MLKEGAWNQLVCEFADRFEHMAYYANIMASGVSLYTLRTGENTETRKLLLIR